MNGMLVPAQKKNMSLVHMQRGQIEALFEAIKWDNFRTVRAMVKRNPGLINQQADLRVYSRFLGPYDLKGLTPLHIASYYDREKMVRYLISAGADVNAPDEKGTTPVSGAVAKGYNDLLNIFLKKGADVNRRNKTGASLLHTAALYNQKRTMEILVENGAEIDARANSGWTPLHNAVINDYLYITEYLLKKGADPNAQITGQEGDHVGTPGDTPLHMTYTDYHTDIAELLLRYGADINIKNNEGLTVLQKAIERENKIMIEFLRKQGAKEEFCNVPFFEYPEIQDSINKIIEGLRPFAEEEYLTTEEQNFFLSRVKMMIHSKISEDLIHCIDNVVPHDQAQRIREFAYGISKNMTQKVLEAIRNQSQEGPEQN